MMHNKMKYATNAPNAKPIGTFLQRKDMIPPEWHTPVFSNYIQIIGYSSNIIDDTYVFLNLQNGQEMEEYMDEIEFRYTDVDFK